MFFSVQYVVRIWFIIININFISTDLVNDYVELIHQEIDKSFKYKKPTDNSEYFGKDTPTKITEYGIYDFIVVGAGSAGAIVAKRLSERKWKTLLIEAGEQQNTFSDIPGTFLNLQNSSYNWGYYTTPQSFFCQGMINKQCSYPRGKSLGGSSVINGMIYARGNEHDQNRWSDFGITGWSWKECLPYYKKLENYQNIYGDEGYHGYYGPVTIDYSRPSSFLVRSFLNANAEIGKVTKDYNGKFYMGAGRTHYTKKRGIRASTNRAYLTHTNKYLTILTKCLVYKVIIKTKRAIGIEFIQNNTRYRVHSKYEVILSAGSINTPQILMLSGIGPQAELQNLSIPIIKNLPVGENLIDHIGNIGLQFESSVILTNSSKTMEEYVWEFLSETGELTETQLQALSFISTDNNDTFPDIEIMFVPRGSGVGPYVNNYNLAPDILKTLEQVDDINRVFQMVPMLLHPKSRGSVKLKSNNPSDFPLIDTNSLADEDDMNRMYNSIIYILNLLRTKAFSTINAKLLKQIFPACGRYEYLSRDFWYCHIRHTSHTIYHPVGTCRMGTNANNSVVNNKLNVHGINGLRIIDASIVPSINSGHVQSLAMMIGEKGADLINREYPRHNITTPIIVNS